MQPTCVARGTCCHTALPSRTDERGDSRRTVPEQVLTVLKLTPAARSRPKVCFMSRAERPGRQHPQRLGLWLLRLAGFAGKAAQIPRVVKLALVKDSNALRTQLLRWANMESLTRILVSHGEPIEANPRQTLRDLAGSLGRP